MASRPQFPSDPGEWATTLAHHDAAIGNLSQRMHGVETGMRTLQGEVHTGFSTLNSQFAQLGSGLSTLNSKLDAQPKFSLHESVSTVLALSVLFSMVVGGIIWVTTSQFSGVVAEQRSFNSSISTRVDKAETSIDKIKETIGNWATTAEKQR